MASDARREVVRGITGEPALGEPDVVIETNDVSANRGGGSSGSSSASIVSGSGSGSTPCSGRRSASAGGNS